MSAKRIRVKAVRRAEVDVDKLVAGLMLLVEQLAKEQTEAGSKPEEPAA